MQTCHSSIHTRIGQIGNHFNTVKMHFSNSVKIYLSHLLKRERIYLFVICKGKLLNYLNAITNCEFEMEKNRLFRINCVFFFHNNILYDKKCLLIFNQNQILPTTLFYTFMHILTKYTNELTSDHWYRCSWLTQYMYKLYKVRLLLDFEIWSVGKRRRRHPGLPRACTQN